MVTEVMVAMVMVDTVVMDLEGDVTSAEYHVVEVV